MVKTNRFVFWAPRILMIVFALFLAIFSFDVFDNCNGFFGCALALFMHNIPSLILLVILIISWKREIVGAIVFGFLGIAGIIGTIVTMMSIPGSKMFNPIFPILGIICSFVGILFLMNWNGKKNKSGKRKR